MITRSRLQELLDYDQETGLFFWKRGMKGPARKGSKAGWSRNDGYVVIKIDGKKEYAHRIAWVFAHGSIDESLSIDHIDNNPANNAIVNLRVVDKQQNNMNRSRSPKNESGVMGVFWAKHANKWAAQIRHNRKSIHIGYFDSIEQARQARIKEETRLGFHINHGRNV